VNAAELPAPQLGRILIAAGLLTEEQLAQALEEQAQTGRRLGEIIVQRGFISGPALANALAEQHGGVLKTEYGFASGLGGVAARRAASEAGTPISPLRPPDPTPMPTLRTAEPQAVSLVPDEEQASAPSEELPEPTPQRDALEPVTPSESDQTLEPQPLLRPAEPPAPAFEEPPEPAPPPAAVSPVSPPEPPAPPEPLFPLARPTEPLEPPLEPEPTLPPEVVEPELEPAELRRPDPEPVQQVPPLLPPEPEALAPPEPESTSPVEVAEPELEPVELRPPAPEAPLEAPQPHAPEPEVLAPPEPEPTPPAESAEPIPEPVELRPSAPEPVPEAQPVVPEPEPTPPAEAAEPVPEPVELPAPPEPEPEPEPPVAAKLDDRDELIESLRARVEAQERELAKLREELEERARKDVQVHVWPEEQPVVPPPGPVQAEHYLLCVPTPAGYVLLDRVGPLPSVGQAVEVPEEEGRFTVTKVVRLPRNGRPCAYLQRA
jgi:hypothetical protein